MERKKVISGRDAGRLTKIAGLIGENFRGAEPYTVDRFKAALENGEFAFPGGYPTYFITDDGDSLSYDSAKENAEQIIDAIETGDNSGWRVVGQEVNWEDPELYCADSGKRIPSAYAEPEEEIESDEEHDPSDDFIDSDPWTHGPDNDLYGESKNKKSIKLSSLSEDLRKEVKSLMKEGKVKLSQMSEDVRRKVVKENEEGAKGFMTKTKIELKNKRGDVIPIGSSVKVEFLPSDDKIAILFGDVRVHLSLVNAHKVLPKFSKPPSDKAMEKMGNDGVCTTPTGHRTEPDGYGPDGSPSWMKVMGFM